MLAYDDEGVPDVYGDLLLVDVGVCVDDLSDHVVVCVRIY